MFLFLIRHALSETSRENWQTPDSKLGKVGEKQAEVLGSRSRFSGTDNIFSSNWERSLKTAEIISSNLGVKTEILDYIHEREQSPEIYGTARDSEISKKYVRQSYENFGDLDWKFEDKEESIREVLERASKLSKFLTENYQGKRILVVSHDIFIRCFISRILLGSKYSDKTMARTISSITINHAGISLLIYSSQMKSWKINYINDYSHLNI